VRLGIALGLGAFVGGLLWDASNQPDPQTQQAHWNLGALIHYVIGPNLAHLIVGLVQPIVDVISSGSTLPTPGVSTTTQSTPPGPGSLPEPIIALLCTLRSSA